MPEQKTIPDAGEIIAAVAEEVQRMFNEEFDLPFVRIGLVVWDSTDTFCAAPNSEQEQFANAMINFLIKRFPNKIHLGPIPNLTSRN